MRRVTWMAWAACGKSRPGCDRDGLDDSLSGPAVGAAFAGVPWRDVFPGQGAELAEQAGLVALDRDQVVRSPAVQVGGVLALSVQRVRSDHDTVQAGDLVQQAGEHGDLVRLAIHRDLSEHDPGSAVQAGHQVRRGIGTGPGAAQGLAVDREHHPPARRPPGGQLPAHPRPDGSIQGCRVHGGQHPPDGHQVRDSAAQPQPGAQPRRGVGSPFRDRRIRTRPGQRRAHGHAQDRRQAITDPAPIPRVRHLCQGFQQPLRRRARKGPERRGRAGQAGPRTAR